MLMKVLVTGGAGFIGYHTVNKLISEKCDVTILDNLSTGLKKNINSQTKFINMDIKSAEIEKLFKEESFDYVIHLAAQTMVPISMEDPLFDCQENILGTVNLLEACRRTKVKRIVFASTAAVYGYSDLLPINEEVITQPASFYGLSKLTIEKYLILYQKSYGLNNVILRYANVFGEQQGEGGEGGVISIFLRKLANNEPITVFGDGSQTRDFIYVGDIAAANYQALLSEQPNRVYNVSTNLEISISEMLGVMQNIAGKEIVKIFSEPREGDIYKSCLSNTAALNLLKWQPEVAFAVGMAKAYKSLKL